MRHISKKGYFTLEAAIVLPIFIIGVLTFGYCIKVFSTSENITHSMIDETGHLAAKAYGTQSAFAFPAKLKQRLQKENQRVREIQVKHFRYLYSDRKKDGLITIECIYKIDLSLPLNFVDAFEMKSRIKCRGFIGKRAGSNAMAFAEMERNGDSELVWIFPEWGRKYHKENCIYVKENAMQMVLTNSLKKRFRVCKLCKSGDALMGSYVYCFLKEGKVYHKDNCKMVDKYTIEIGKEDAVAKGYSPCLKCGGK